MKKKKIEEKSGSLSFTKCMQKQVGEWKSFAFRSTWTLTVVPCTFIAWFASKFSLSRYSWAARELYFCWASVVLQLCCRKNWPALAFPPNCICRSWIHVQFVSRFVERTNVKWTPRFRWTAEQSMHMNTPYVTEDQVGFFALQSKHVCERAQSNIINYYLGHLVSAPPFVNSILSEHFRTFPWGQILFDIWFRYTHSLRYFSILANNLFKIITLFVAKDLNRLKTASMSVFDGPLLLAIL